MRQKNFLSAHVSAQSKQFIPVLRCKNNRISVHTVAGHAGHAFVVFLECRHKPLDGFAGQPWLVTDGKADRVMLRDLVQSKMDGMGNAQSTVVVFTVSNPAFPRSFRISSYWLTTIFFREAGLRHGIYLICHMAVHEAAIHLCEELVFSKTAAVPRCQKHDGHRHMVMRLKAVVQDCLQHASADGGCLIGHGKAMSHIAARIHITGFHTGSHLHAILQKDRAQHRQSVPEPEHRSHGPLHRLFTSAPIFTSPLKIPSTGALIRRSSPYPPIRPGIPVFGIALPFQIQRPR